MIVAPGKHVVSLCFGPKAMTSRKLPSSVLGLFVAQGLTQTQWKQSQFIFVLGNSSVEHAFIEVRKQDKTGEKAALRYFA